MGAKFGHIVSDETRKKLSLNTSARRTETRKKMSEAAKRRLNGNNWLGRKHTELSKEKMKKVHTGFKHTEISKKRMSGRTSWNKGKKGLKGKYYAWNKGIKTAPPSIHIPALCVCGCNGVVWNRKSKYLLGHNKSRKGVPVTILTRLKMSETLRGKVGEKARNWRGGISFEPYCPKFNNQLKERIRERDNRTCQLCGEKENGRKLAVHHIHYDKPNCIPDLIALCLKCNIKANSNRDYWENFFMEKLNKRGLCASFPKSLRIHAGRGLLIFS